MQILDGRGNLEEVLFRLGTFQHRLLDELFKQLLAIHQLQHDEQEIGCVTDMELVTGAWVLSV